MLTEYFRNALEHNDNSQNEKDKKTLCSACMYHDLIWRFCMDEEVCLLLCMEGRFFWLPQYDMTMDVDIRSKWQLLQLGLLLHRGR